MSERNNKRIVLVNPPLSMNNRYGQLGQAGGSEPPLGLCYLAGVIKQEGFDVRIIDSQALGLGIGQTAGLIEKLHPKYVGISAATIAIESASELARNIKALDPKIKVIIGGCHVSALPIETLKEYESFDVGVVGEGENTIIELISAVDNNVDLKTVRGIVSRQNGEVWLSAERSRIKNLDNLPYPAFDLLPEINRFYRLPTQSLMGKNSFSLVTSRGCPGECSFCDKKVFGEYVSMHSPEYIMEMMRILHKAHKINNILFEDDNFMVSKQRLRVFSDLFRKESLDVRWSALARVDYIDKELLQIAKEAGCWQISYGIESGSQKILDFYHKGVSLSQIKETIEMTKNIGLRIKCFFMWGNPYEDRDTIAQTINFIKGLDIDDISITFFTPYPGSKIWPDIKSYGGFDGRWRELSCFTLVFKPSELEESFLINTRKNVLKDFYFRPKAIFSYLKRIKSVTQFKELILSFYHLFGYIFTKERRNAQTGNL